MTESAVPSALLLGLGLKLYPGNMLRMLNKDLTRFMPSLSRGRQNQVSERKTLLEGWQIYFRSQCLRANGKRSELLPNQSTDGMGFLGYFLVLRKQLLVHFCFVLWVLLSSVSFQSFALRHLVIAAICKAKKLTSSAKLLTFN